MPGIAMAAQACLLRRHDRSRTPFMTTMRALRLLADRQVDLVQADPPPLPSPGEVQLRVKAVGLNHIDVWGFRGMAFAKRLYPLTVGAEVACEVVAVGDGVDTIKT